MNLLDYVVLLGTMLGIALYGMWLTRDRHNLDSYLRGSGDSRWFVVGLSVMATQASAITFLSTPGRDLRAAWALCRFISECPSR
jgi:Na+/proline symporter